MNRNDFERLVQEAFERLPARVREQIQNVALLVEDEPSPTVRARENLRDDETLLGYYQGTPLTERGESYGIGETVPDTVTLYQNPIEQAAFEDGMDVRDVVADTLWHEFAHHFGMNENQVREREQKRNP